MYIYYQGIAKKMSVRLYQYLYELKLISINCITHVSNERGCSLLFVNT
jgi:hypothetical protein